MADTEEKKTLEDTEKHSKKRIYLDYNATTPLSAEVVKAVTEALQEAWGNPSSSYSAGCMAKQLIDKARAHIASMVKGKPEDIIFTSGGTEANNMVLFSAVEQFNIRAKESSSNGVDKALPHIITSNVEHDSIVLPLQHLQRAHRAEVTFVPVSTTTGRVEIDDVIAALRPNTCLVSVMLANNETGVIMPVGELSQRLAPISKQRASQGLPAILLHTDAAQALGKIRVDVQELQVNYLTIVGHKEPETNEELNVSTPITPAHRPKKRKNLGEATTLFLTKATTAVQWKPDESDAFGIITANKLKEMSEEHRQFAESLLPEVLNQGFYGPRIGALYVRGIGHQTPLLPMLYGGGQERNYRPGTENTPMIVGLGKAAELVSLHCAVYKSHLREVRDYLEQRLQAVFGDRIRFNSHFPGTKRLPNTCNVSLLKPSVLGREWLAHCHSLQASVGAACHSDRGDSPSHVLLSSGVSRESARGAVRLSVGRETSREDVDVIVRDLEQAAQKLECKESSKRDLKT